MSILNRRQILIGSAATAAVLATPSIVQASVPDSSAVLANVVERLNYLHHSQEPSLIRGYRNHLLADFDVSVNTLLIQRHPELFLTENHNFGGPSFVYETSMLKDWDVQTRAAAAVRSRMFQAQFGFPNFLPLSTLKEMVDEIAGEIRQEQRRFDAAPSHQGRPGWKMVSYMPALTYRLLDPNTFQPAIRFKTRYAIIHKDGVLGVA